MIVPVCIALFLTHFTFCPAKCFSVAFVSVCLCLVLVVYTVWLAYIWLGTCIAFSMTTNSVCSLRYSANIIHLFSHRVAAAFSQGTGAILLKLTTQTNSK